MAFHSTHYQRVQSSEEDLLEEDLPPTVVSPRSLDERGEMFCCKIFSPGKESNLIYQVQNFSA